MRARLEGMRGGQEFTFLCVPEMAVRMDAIVDDGGGEISSRDVRNYGIVLSVRKKQPG